MRLNILLLIGMLICSINAHSQAKPKYSTKSKKAIALYEAGQTAHMQEQFRSAVEMYEEAKRIDPKFTESYFMCAEAYMDLGNYEQQIENLKKGFSLDSTIFVTGYYQAGVALCRLGRFPEATEWFELYKHYSKGKRTRYNVDAWLKKALIAKELMENPVPFNPRPISSTIQSPYDMYWPSITLDEEEFVFTMLVPRDTTLLASNPHLPKNSRFYNEEFYMSTKENDKWGNIQPILGINTVNNEGAQALSIDGKWMFYTACGREDSRGSCDLYFSQRTPSGWSQPINIGQPVNSAYWESQPCFSADGKTLYFVSNRPGGKGDNDIWYAEIVGFKNNGVPIFGEVKNAGDSINTPGKETSPFIHADNKTIYFSSNTWPGVGDSDIFYSRRSDNHQWSTPKNIGYPINTPNDDIGFIVSASGTTAYFSSTKKLHNGTSKKELLCIDMPENARPTPVSYIKGKVYDIKTLKPLSANIELVRLDNGKKQTQAISDSHKGSFLINLPSGYDYGLFAQCNGYFFFSENLSIKSSNQNNSSPMTIDIPLTPLVKGEKIALKNVFFDTNSTTLKPESRVELDKLVVIMKQNPNIRIEIGGHTDNVGTAEYNRRLSEGRAKTTSDYLISQGIPANRLVSKGYGLNNPIATNDTEEGRAINRRTEAKIIE